VGELLLIARRNARGSLGRTGMTPAVACLGDAFLTGSLAVSGTLAGNIAVLSSSHDDSVDVVVRGESVAFRQRTSLDETLESQAAAGLVEGFAQPTDLAGNPLGSAQHPGLGRTWIDEPAAQSLPLVAGTGPAAAAEVVLDTTTAEAGEIAVGDQTQIATAVRVQTVGAAGIADMSSGTGSALTWFEPATPPSLIGGPGLAQEIFVASDDSSTPEELATAVAGSQGAGVESAALPARRADRIDVLDAIRGE
jgi:putative ABC transport system permease protein